ncbi:MAG: acyltransferase [Chitinophagaceae bacterium]
MPPPRTTFAALTGIRAIAAIMVFLYHHRKFWYSFMPEVISRFLNEFHTGVSLFFVLSGFLIAFTYEDKPMQNGNSYLRYLLIRLARIFPVYLLLLSVKYIDQGFPDSTTTFLTYTLWHGFSDQYNLTGLPQAWSLTVELSFYTLAPFIYYLSKKSVLKTFFFLLLLLFITLGIGYGWYAWNGNSNSFFYPWSFVLNATFSGRFAEFFAGMLLARYVQYGRQYLPFPKRHITLTGAIATLACIYLISLFEKDLYHTGTDTIAGLAIRNLLLPLCMIWLLYGLIQEKTWLRWTLSTKLMVLLGNASFAFYLFHINYVNGLTYKWHLFPDRNFTFMWLLAIAMYLLIEKPIYLVLRKLIERIDRQREEKFVNRELVRRES